MTENIEDRASDAPRPSADKADGLYLAYIQVRNTELAVHWKRYSFHFAVNFGLLAAVLTRASDPFVAAHLHLITIIGAELALVWLLLSMQSKKIVNRWEGHLRTCEDRMARPESRLFQKIADEEGTKSWWRRNWQNLNLFTWALPALCFLAWCMLFAAKKLD
jgi:hypothetical protein